MKKNILTISYLIGLSFLMFSCDEPLNFMDVEGLGLSDHENVPDKVYEFLDLNFPDYKERNIKVEDICSDSLIFEVELEEGNQPDVDVYFDENGNFWFVASKILYNDLPDAVKERVDTLEADLKVIPKDIEKWEFSTDSVIYKLELRSQGANLDVLISPDGTVICLDDDSEHDDEGEDDDDDSDDDDSDDDDSDDDDSDDDDSDDDKRDIPNMVKEFISQEYPTYTIEEAETDEFCDGTRYHEVSLESDSDADRTLFFSMDWDLQIVASEISEADLPAAIQSTINADYADYMVDSDDIYRLEWSDGTVRYEVELENNEDDIELIFNEDGSIYCEEK